jgi:hypothetical protein
MGYMAREAAGWSTAQRLILNFVLIFNRCQVLFSRSLGISSLACLFPLSKLQPSFDLFSKSNPEFLNPKKEVQSNLL